MTVKGKRNTKETAITDARSTAKVYYDISSELDNLYDGGDYFVDDIHSMLMRLDGNFSTEYIHGTDRLGNNVSGDVLLYNRKEAMIIVDYIPCRAPMPWPEYWSRYKGIDLEAIKSIYVSTNNGLFGQFIDNKSTIPTHRIAEVIGCAVFIETHPDSEVSVSGGKGTRKTVLDGYSTVKEFYRPDYSTLPPQDDDYRRTLYWNPAVATDSLGRAQVSFYNNSRSRRFSISAETVSPNGAVGTYSD